MLEKTPQAPGLSDFEAAAARIKERVRRTPLIRARFLREPPTSGIDLRLKLECLQVTGSFKPRGANNALLSLTEEQLKRGVITASGGNHGVAVAYAAWASKVPAVIYLSENAPPIKAEKLCKWGAEVVIEGAVWDDANAAALKRMESEGLTYVHPFADPMVIAGQGSLGVEMLKQTPETEVFVVAIGGGGLISGVSAAVKAIKPEARVIGVEPVGAPTLHNSLAEGNLVTLPEIETDAGTLAPRRSADINLDMIRKNVDEIVLVTDEEMREAAKWLWFEFGVAAELSGAASLAAVMKQRFEVSPGAVVTAIICGAGADGIN